MSGYKMSRIEELMTKLRQNSKKMEALFPRVASLLAQGASFGLVVQRQVKNGTVNRSAGEAEKDRLELLQKKLEDEMMLLVEENATIERELLPLLGE